jgi:hypothetical protein
MHCTGFAAGETLNITYIDGALPATADATGACTMMFEVPTGFAGSTVPGRTFTFHGEGRK